jgi:hypothetical protein
MTTFKKAIAAFTLVVVSAIVGLLLCEFGSRLILNPADYFSVEMVPDTALGAFPSPAARTGFDAWGFRNRKVPDTSDIVAIGDSHTYGNTATMEDSWPYVVGRLTGRHVYNMGMGGYGPNQYFYLLKNKALGLKPRVIICGLYMGDDFENAYSITYGLDYWTSLRKQPAQKVDFNIWGTQPTVSWDKNVRVWLSRHSVIYQLVFHGPIMGLLQGEYQIKNASALYPGEAVTLNLPEKQVLEAFRPKGLLLRLDQQSEPVQEGMRITFELLKEMKEICDQQQIRFVVVVIPTKEQVFSEYLEHNPKLLMSNVLDSLIANERVARDRTFQFLTGAGIDYVDTLPALKGAIEQKLYARTAADMHPNKNGYAVIAKATVQALGGGLTH